MALTLNVQARNGILDTGLNTLFDGGRLRIYSGSKPATANLAPTGTLLADITLPADAFAAASSGAVAKSGTWSDSSADGGSGTTGGYFRFSASGDTLALDAAFARIDGVIGTDMTLDGTITAGQAVTVNTFTMTMPAS